MDHHAYLVSDESFLDEFLKTHSISMRGNPDVATLEGDTFSVEDARDLKERAETKGFGGKRLFILRFRRFTLEAQNALLKTFEEPIKNTHFIIFGKEDMFLPTILSRVQIIRSNLQNPHALPASGLRRDSDFADSPEKFIKMSLKKRLDFVKEFVDTEGREGLTKFLDSLLLHLKSSKASNETLKKVFRLRKYSDDPAALPRLILEHLALVI